MLLILFTLKVLFACGDHSDTRENLDGFGAIGNFNPFDLAVSGISPDNSTLILGTCLARESEIEIIRDNSQQVLDSLKNEIRITSIQIEFEKGISPIFPKKLDSIIALRTFLLRSLYSTNQAKTMYDFSIYLVAFSAFSAAVIVGFRINRRRLGDT